MASLFLVFPLTVSLLMASLFPGVSVDGFSVDDVSVPGVSVDGFPVDGVSVPGVSVDGFLR